LNAILCRYLTLAGLLLACGWTVSSPAEWEPWTVFLLTLAAYIGTDVYAVKSGQAVIKLDGPDQALFRKFLRDIPTVGSISFIKDADMAGCYFPSARLEQLRTFWHGWENADHEFMDKQLEAKRKVFHTLVATYMKAIGTNTFPTRVEGFQTVPPEWETEQPERFNRVVDELHRLAGQIVEVHQDLVRLGRSRLGITGVS
jgi:hypothetical protein